MHRLRKKRANRANCVILEVLPGQAWKYEEWHQPLYGTLGSGTDFTLVGPSPQGRDRTVVGMGMDGAGDEAMYEKHLNRVHLSRLSPVMWSYKKGYPRKELGVPIKPAYNGMGDYGTATPINPKGSPVWSETWQQRAAGALQRVNMQAMDGCRCGVGTDGEDTQGRSFLGLGLLVVCGAGLLYWYTR